MRKRSLAPLDHISQSQKSTERIDEEQAELMTMREDLMHRPERLRIKHACRKKPRGWNIASLQGSQVASHLRVIPHLNGPFGNLL